MFSFKGDAHRLYLKLRKTVEDKSIPIYQLKEIQEIHEVKHFYQQLRSDELEYVSYRLLKEKQGTGIVPVLVYTVPWLIFIFSERFQNFLFETGQYMWLVFIIPYVALLFASLFLHYREKAWASVHLEIVLNILKERKQKNNS